MTYNKWPLYTYAGDSSAGQAGGQGLNLNGGKWYVISAKGKVVKASQSSGGGTTTTSPAMLPARRGRNRGQPSG